MMPESPSGAHRALLQTLLGAYGDRKGCPRAHFTACTLFGCGGILQQLQIASAMGALRRVLPVLHFLHQRSTQYTGRQSEHPDPENGYR